MFSRVCLFTGGISGLVSFLGGGYLWYQVPSSVGIGRGVLRTPTPDTWDTMGYGQQAGSTHPTGMPSCLILVTALRKLFECL